MFVIYCKGGYKSKLNMFNKIHWIHIFILNFTNIWHMYDSKCVSMLKSVYTNRQINHIKNMHRIYKLKKKQPF